MSNEPTDDKTKTYSLKPAETNMLRFIHNHQQAIFSGVLSTISIDRLAYHVSENTKFELNGDFTQLRLTEMPPAETVAPTPEQSADAASPVVSAPDTQAQPADAPKAEPEAPVGQVGTPTATAEPTAEAQPEQPAQ